MEKDILNYLPTVMLRGTPGSLIRYRVRLLLSVESARSLTSFTRPDQLLVSRIPTNCCSNWVSHLPLVLLGLCSVPKEDTGFSVSEAVYGSPLTIPGEFLEASEIPSSQFISKVEKVIAGFSTPPPHHVHHSPPAEIPAALKTAKFVFVTEDASKPSLSPLYQAPYLVMEGRSKFFRLQIGTKVDSLSLDRLKLVISDSPVIPAAPPPRGLPPLCQSKDPLDPSSATKSSPSKNKSVLFLTQPVIIPRRNTHRQARKEAHAPPDSAMPSVVFGAGYPDAAR